jgi:hypothetical protein
MSSRAERIPGRRTWWFASALFVAGLAAVIFSVYDEPTRRSLVVGEPSPQTFVAPVELQVVDRLATEVRRQAARAQVPELTSPDPALRAIVLESLEAIALPPSRSGGRSPRVMPTRAGVRARDMESVLAAAVEVAPRCGARAEVAHRARGHGWWPRRCPTPA